MRYQLPTQHYLYFGIQAKKGKLDASGVTKGTNVNVAEIYNQVLMMLAHEIFDPETNRKVLVDHAFIVAGGEITKAARQLLGGQARRDQAQPDHVHGSRRHPESLHRPQRSVAGWCATKIHFRP